jgi:hypothetical protein
VLHNCHSESLLERSPKNGVGMRGNGNYASAAHLPGTWNMAKFCVTRMGTTRVVPKRYGTSTRCCRGMERVQRRAKLGFWSRGEGPPAPLPRSWAPVKSGVGSPCPWHHEAACRLRPGRECPWFIVNTKGQLKLSFDAAELRENHNLVTGIDVHL